MVIRLPEERTEQGGYAVLDDRVLVLDFQAGNPQAFVEIHTRYAGLARQVCRRFLPNPQDADEAFQETMIRAFQGLYRFNGRYALGPWIARIAKNVSLDILRGRARRPQMSDSPASEELSKPGDEADEIVERLVQRDLVLSTLADLPESHRQALMLRELEGRSHREVAQALEITPSQAKALIHRAKGSFRRRWLEKLSERGGLMGIALLPLLWLARAAYGARRVVDRLGSAAHVAQAAAPEAVTQVATATPAAAGMGERLVAAGMTILVAGGVTFGAAKIASRDEPEPTTAAPAAAAPAGFGSETDPNAEEGLPPVEPGSARLERPERDTLPVVTDPGPTDEPAPTVEPNPSTEPSPSTDPGPTGPPGPPPAPSWSGSVRVNWATDQHCGCGGGVVGGDQSSTGSVGQDSQLTVRQGFNGAALDAEGDPAWEMTGEYLATLGTGDGSLEMIVRLKQDGNSHSFLATAGSATVNFAPGEPTTYTFYGDYSLAYGEPHLSPIPTSGRFAVQLKVWSDGTSVFGLDVLLNS